MKRLRWIPLAIFAALAPAVFASGVTDDGKFFSDEALKTARTEIQRLHDKYDKDITVETFAKIPDKKSAEFQAAEKNRFFTDWFRERSKALNVKGVYILICREPAHLQVGASAQLYRDGFTVTDRDELRNTLVESFKKKNYDEGLTAALNLLAGKFDDMSRTHPTSARPSGGGYAPAGGTRIGGSDGASALESHALGWGSWLLIIIVGFLLLRFVLRLFTRPSFNQPTGMGPASPGYGYGPGFGGAPGGGGGGFFSSMLGGMFGGMAGNWAANHWFGGGMENPQAPRTPDSDNTSSGGDFGPPSDIGGGGGDFGGGGGGDFGGGGGGGDSGGGGGGGGDF